MHFNSLFSKALAVLTLVGAPCQVVRAYEIHFTEDATDPCTTCWAAPCSWSGYRVYLDGNLYGLRRCGDRLEGFSPRTGRITGCVTNDDCAVCVPLGEQKGVYKFRKGKLLSFRRDSSSGGKTAAEAMRRQLTREMPENSIWCSLWTRGNDDDGRRFWRQDATRLKLWFENPNEAGALLALLALLALAGFFAARGPWKVHSLLWMIIIGVFLIQSGSRGAVMAFLSGAGVMAFFDLWRRFSSRRLLALVAGVIVLAGCVFLIFGDSRAIGQLFEADEIRLDVWRSVPRMMACAPLGWWANTGRSYCEWFQAFEVFKPLHYLLSSHLSIIVWGGYALMGLYVFLWSAVFHLSFWEARVHGRFFALGQWIGLGVAMIFSPIGLYHWEPWTIPVLALVVQGVRTIRERQFPEGALVRDLIVAGITVGLIAGVGFAMEMRSESPFLVRRVIGGVRVGHGPIEMCVVNDGFVLTGGFSGDLGKEMRSFVVGHPEVGAIKIVDSLDAVPRYVDKLVLTGAFCSEFVARKKKGDSQLPEFDEIYYLSPDFPLTVAKEERHSRGRARVLVGKLAWASLQAGMTVPTRYAAIPGVALYIPDWLTRIAVSNVLP